MIAFPMFFVVSFVGLIENIIDCLGLIQIYLHSRSQLATWLVFLQSHEWFLQKVRPRSSFLMICFSTISFFPQKTSNKVPQFHCCKLKIILILNPKRFALTYIAIILVFLFLFSLSFCPLKLSCFIKFYYSHQRRIRDQNVCYVQKEVKKETP